mmetsp:Transcript_4186/g.6457  ORF Transcript_4186/g.6457 Transcript_4186/m.6457 type:complete len:90 (+) Transcript_4186:27-296(+)
MLAKMQNNDTNVNDSSLQKHVLRGMDPSKKDFNKEEAVLECKSYVHKLSQEACKGRPDRHNYAKGKTRKKNQMQLVAHSPRCLVSFLLF